jgi:predicted CoA-binding protein
MTTMQSVEAFVAQESLAVVGVSRTGKGFGNVALRELRATGKRIYPVHPGADQVQGIPCAASLTSLPEPVGGVLVVVPPEQTEAVVREAAEAGIGRVWMQQGSQSPAAIAYCEEHGIDAVHGECILMFLPKGAVFHRFHRGMRRLFGKLPQ